MAGKLTIEVVTPTRKGIELYRSRVNFGAKTGIEQLTRFFGELASGAAPSVVRVLCDDSTGVSASQTIAPSFANLVTGDTVSIIDPTGKAYTFVGQTTAVTLGDLTFRIQTNDATTGTSLAAQINGYPGLKGIATAAGTATVTVTLTQKGTAGNFWRVKKGAGNGSASAFTLGGATFTGGKDAGQLQSLTATLGGALTANDTVTIGSVTLTAKASPAGENQFAATVSAAADGAALAACINAHSVLKGLISASGTSTVTLTCSLSGRSGALVSVSKSAAQITLSASSFAPSTTDTYAASLVTLANGAVAS